MTKTPVITHRDGIWISEAKEKAVIQDLNQIVLESGFSILAQDHNNHGYPYRYVRHTQELDCRVIDSVFLNNDRAWTDSCAIVTDNVPLMPVTGQVLSLVPEFWHIWNFDPVFDNRPATWAFNCLMNRVRGDRSVIFYELIRRNLLQQGLVSYNCGIDQYQAQYHNADLHRYQQQHEIGVRLIPYNNIEFHGTVEQCIIDSKISMVAETYVSHSHIVFSEKIFRCLQLPRPWLLYCSPGAVGLLKNHGFDVMDDVVDIKYDQVHDHNARLQLILDQLQTHLQINYESSDYQRFQQAATRNRQRLQHLCQQWPNRLQQIKQDIQQL